MGNNNLLQEVINDLARAPQRRQPRSTPSRGRITEKDAFLALDQVAADLDKHHQDALARVRALIARYGVDDPLTEVAADLADSAGSALQTRLIELQADAALRRAARRLRVKMERDAEEERERQLAMFRARIHLFYLQQIEFRQERDEERRREMSLAMFLLWMLFIILQNAQNRWRLVRDFACACVPENRRAVAS